MNQDYILFPADYDAYINHRPNNKLDLIWSDIINQISDPQLKKEAKSKGYALVPHESLKENGISKTFTLEVPDGSIKLKGELKRIHNIVSLIKD